MGILRSGCLPESSHGLDQRTWLALVLGRVQKRPALAPMAERIDAMAKGDGRSRSGIIARACLFYLEYAEAEKVIAVPQPKPVSKRARATKEHSTCKTF